MITQENQNELEICIDNKCQISSKLIKTLSEFKQHAQHKTVSFYEIKTMVTQNKDYETLGNLSSVLDDLLVQLNNLQEFIKGRVIEFQQKLHLKVEEQLQKFKGMQALLIAVKENQLNDLPSTQKEFINIEQIAQYFDEIKQIKEKSSCIITSLKSQIETVFQTIKLDTKVQNIFPSPLVQAVNYSLVSKFSSSQKGSTVNVTQDGKIATQTGDPKYTNQTYPNRFVLIEPPLDQKSIRKYGVRIINLAGNIGIGLCGINKIKEINYGLDCSGRGANVACYTIDNYGQFWQHSQPIRSVLNFKYETGEIVIWQFNPTTKLLNFKIVSTNQSYQYQIPTTETEQLAACVWLLSKNDQVKIYTGGIDDWQF